MTSTNEILSVPYPIPGVTLRIKLPLYDRIRCKEYTNTMTWSNGPTLRNEASGDPLENQQKTLHIAPNLVDDFAMLSILDAQHDGGQYLIELFDVNGRKVKEMATSDQQVRIDLSDFSQGLYFVKVSNGTSMWTKKMIKK